MKLHRLDTSQDFWERAGEFLLQKEAEHNLMIGVTGNLLRYPDQYTDSPYLAVVESQGEVIAAALRTPPHNLLVSQTASLEAIALIAQDVYHTDPEIPGVAGLIPDVEAFLKQWQHLSDRACKLTMAMRIYQLTQVKPATRAAGHLRLAQESDRPLLLNWFTEFAASISNLPFPPPERVVTAELSAKTIYLWEDESPVSWATGKRSLPTAARIGPVYTPPTHRRKGYATACVAALSQSFLDQGCHCCYLFTDLKNPTSNHIYQDIGYRPLFDWHNYKFMAQESP